MFIIWKGTFPGLFFLHYYFFQLRRPDHDRSAFLIRWRWIYLRRRRGHLHLLLTLLFSEPCRFFVLCKLLCKLERKKMNISVEFKPPAVRRWDRDRGFKHCCQSGGATREGQARGSCGHFSFIYFLGLFKVSKTL